MGSDRQVVALIGATGGIGQHVLEHALASGHRVRALVRQPNRVAPRSGLTVLQGNVLDGASVERLCEGADIVVSCLGTRRGEPPVVARGTEVILQAMERQGVPRLTMISSIGVGDSADQGRRVSRFFMYVIVPLFLRERFYELARAEARVQSSGVGWVIIRPTGLTHGPAKGAYRICGPESQDTTVQVAREDVARCLVDLVSDSTWEGKAISVFSA
jgi:putative NADH-flavin reductase